MRSADQQLLESLDHLERTACVAFGWAAANEMSTVADGIDCALEHIRSAKELAEWMIRTEGEA